MAQPEVDDFLEDDIIDETAAMDEDLALAEDTGEGSITDGEAELETAAGAGGTMEISTIDVPQMADLQPGDTIDLVTTYNVVRQGDGVTEVEAVDYLPVDAVGGDETIPAAPAGPVGPEGAGGGIEGLLQ